VSPNYAREIQTPDHGFGLDGVLAARGGDLHGILNGIDSEEWNPETDPHLPAGFHARDLSGKRACKKALQEELGLPSRPDVPLFGIIARLTPQKGLDVLAESLGTLLGWNLQMVLLGTGNPELERAFHEISARRPDRFRARIGFDNALAHRIEAGSDFFVMPSRFEPCGLNQLYSLRYGTLPIVRATGGLVDTVLNYDESSGAGTGFAFHSLDAASLTNTIGWALSTYFDRPKHVDAMRRRAMAQDYSWDRAAEQYERVYVEARERRRGNPPFVA
jgi:starch synthase